MGQIQPRSNLKSWPGLVLFYILSWDFQQAIAPTLAGQEVVNRVPLRLDLLNMYGRPDGHLPSRSDSWANRSRSVTWGSSKLFSKL